jgi:hypothetical protein
MQNKDLKKLYHQGLAAVVPPASRARVLALLSLLDAAIVPYELAIPGTGYR